MTVQKNVCDERLGAFVQNHPEFKDFVAPWANLLMLQQEVMAGLSFPEVQYFVWTEEEFLGGVPLATKLPLDFFMESFRECATKMGSSMARIFPPLSESISRIQPRLMDDAWGLQCLLPVILGDVESLAAAASRVQVSPEILLFYVRAVYGPCVSALRPVVEDHPSVELWRKHYCPICGSDPDMETLELHADEGDYVVSKSGQAWLHCPQCGMHWRFSRAVCPSCGTQENSKLSRYALPENSRQFIYACDACNHYLPCMDMVDSATPDTNLDYASLALVHLDAMAQAKGYEPLSPAAWAQAQLLNQQ